MSVIVRAVLIGMAVLLIGTIPRNLLLAANLRYYATVPWAVPLIGIYLWLLWRYMKGGRKHLFEFQSVAARSG